MEFQWRKEKYRGCKMHNDRSKKLPTLIIQEKEKDINIGTRSHGRIILSIIVPVVVAVQH